MDSKTGICLNDEIMIHRLWADDLFTVANNCANAQKQMDGLFSFCRPNQTIVNEIKTKVMVFGHAKEKISITFNGKAIEQVDCYKYLGNMFNSIKSSSGDMFKMNYDYLCESARRAIFAVLKRIRKISPLPPKCMLYIFQSMIEPILLYGSDVWGHST